MTDKKYSVSDEQLGKIAVKQHELFRRVKEGTLEPVTLLKELQFIISGGKDFSQIKSQWEKFYKEVFGKKIDFSNVPVPEADSGYSWFYMNHPEVTLEDLHSGGNKPQPHWKWTDKKLDEVIDWTHGRDSIAQKESYIVRVRPNMEADEDLKNKSANYIFKTKINTMTLKERLGLGRFLYWSENIILDKSVITLCSGSRYVSVTVPSVSRYNVRVGVDWHYLGITDGHLRPRRAVSLLL